MKRVRVIKLGGSLLGLPELSEKFHRWCGVNPHPLTFVIVGGGGIVDAVREIDRAQHLDESFAHWVCMDLLEHTARLAHRIIGSVDLYETLDDLQQPLLSRNENSAPIVAIVQTGICFARGLANFGLADSWSVTSDALAAAFGNLHAAEELVMMKSTDVPPVPMNLAGLSSLAEGGWVDPCFPSLAAKIDRVRFVNLRSF